MILSAIQRKISYKVKRLNSCARFNSRLRMNIISIDQLVFDNRNIRNLPIDPESRNFCRQVPNAIFSLVDPTPVVNPQIVSISIPALSLLGLSSSQDSYSKTELSKISTYLSGNSLIPSGSQTYAHVYCGHQFGNFAGQLGDGAAISLGEVINENGDRYELQLKGAGLTPFSRSADGRKVLRSSIREFLCSEAMHFLGIPTTRAGSVITSDSTVKRDPMYDGGVIDEKCTIVSRIAENFFRFGSFEIFRDVTGDRKGPSAHNSTLKLSLLRHILLYFPKIQEVQNERERVQILYQEIVKRTALLVARSAKAALILVLIAHRWQCVGFVHGVLNTDNMSIMGLTIDYGPFGFMEFFDPDFTPNGSDSSARYCYKNQPQICEWNLRKLAEVLEPHLSHHDAEMIISGSMQWHSSVFEGEGPDIQGVSGYRQVYAKEYARLMRDKLGLLSERKDDMALFDSFFHAMEKSSTDFTNAFQVMISFVRKFEQSAPSAVDSLISSTADELASISATPQEIIAARRRALRIHRLQYHPQQLMQFLHFLDDDIFEEAELSELFGGAPIPVIREHLADEKKKLDIIGKIAQDIESLNSTTLEKKRISDRINWNEWLLKYVSRLRNDDYSVESKSSERYESPRIQQMRLNNPTFILRNWIAQEAIAAAEQSDFSKVDTVLGMLFTPYEEKFSSLNGDQSALTAKQREFVQNPPDWASSLICTCSS